MGFATPLLIIGGVDATSRRSSEASFNGADGVVGNGTSCKKRIPKHFGNPDHPVCAAAVASHLFLMAQPPLLYQEGSGAPHSFFLDQRNRRGHRPRLQNEHSTRSLKQRPK